VTPAHGFTYPSARAILGALTSATVADSTIALIEPRITLALVLALDAPHSDAPAKGVLEPSPGDA
jgi:hypothetical protein